MEKKIDLRGSGIRFRREDVVWYATRALPDERGALCGLKDGRLYRMPGELGTRFVEAFEQADSLEGWLCRPIRGGGRFMVSRDWRNAFPMNRILKGHECIILTPEEDWPGISASAEVRGVLPEQVVCMGELFASIIQEQSEKRKDVPLDVRIRETLDPDDVVWFRTGGRMGEYCWRTGLADGRRFVFNEDDAVDADAFLTWIGNGASRDADMRTWRKYDIGFGMTAFVRENWAGRPRVQEYLFAIRDSDCMVYCDSGKKWDGERHGTSPWLLGGLVGYALGEHS